MTYQTISIRQDGPVDWLTLNRPDRLNTITGRMVEELCGYFDGLKQDYGVRIVVMRGAGRGFCAGLDIKEHQHGERMDGGGGTLHPGYPLFDIVKLMRDCPQPIVALLHGPVCGGGMGFALAADIRIAGESMRMNDAFVALGRSGCELGVTYFLPRIVGLGIATELMYTGAFIGAARAKEVGLVNKVSADDDMEAAAAEYLEPMLRTAPLGLRMTKQTLNRALRVNDLLAVMDLEWHAQEVCGGGPDFDEAMNAFIEKRSARYTLPDRRTSA
ncbi:enoyl-CoA hydratase/isomerase family protein [Chelatococcus reniformis]|uniref:Enoyl-CoA hydratase n=1 Tax=Chelatococcus reniformis TaxID=1494448 RepID=A0A916UXY5_9HYPH|nr:enoyl-CoA hydratase/isomerase family protein [Chelatococcus reniformis]GGC93341.1 enoyl-CoA hydratase [Chelatococcus reniformis]